ncbi:MAG: helix-turn-helix domain-containing protein [Planctomycetota bacterium]
MQRIARMHLQRNSPVHAHDWWELVVILSGCGQHHCQDAEWHLLPGDCLLIPPGQRHCYRSVQSLELVNLLIAEDGTWRDGLPQKHPATARLRLSWPQLCRVDEYLDEEALQDLDGFIALLGSAPSLPVADGAVLQTLLRFLAGHLQEDIDRATCCRQAGRSRSALHRDTHHLLGCPPLRVLENCRLLRARQLLRWGREPVQAIAAAVGMPDANCFARRFRLRCGESPSADRRRRRAGPGA